jgi:class 3 adenylate cyclase
VKVPTLLLCYEGEPFTREEAEYMSARIPDCRVQVFPGHEADSDFAGYFDAIRSFLGVDETPYLDTILTTVLFTDIVGSTELQARLHDHGWRELLERHHTVVRKLLAEHQGVELDTAGDGFFARFDGPARAVHCAQAIAQAVLPLGIEIRAGVHTGECEVADGKCTGLAVSIGARIVAMARASDVLVSQTVKDLVAGSGLTFDDAGEHDLKGVPGRWHLYRVVAR